MLVIRIASKHHACTLFELEKKGESALTLTALSDPQTEPKGENSLIPSMQKCRNANLQKCRFAEVQIC